MQFIDLESQYRKIESAVQRRIQTVLEHGRYIMGPEVPELEERLADYVGVKHCIGVASGSDALQVALMALGIGYGDEVIVPAFTFIATAEIVALLGAKPIFVDVDSRNYTIDPDKIERVMTPKTRAIIPVSLYGQCADFDGINAAAKRHGIAVIEDGAQSFGATVNGKRSCGLSTIGCTSFFPSKPLGAYGDGGACFTDDDTLAEVMRQIRVHGQDRRYHHARIGFNGRLDTLQAAILLAKMAVFPDEVQRRWEIGNRYSAFVQERCPDVVTPYIQPGNRSVYAQYTLQVENRDKVQMLLKEKGIPTAVHYPIPLHRQPVFMDLCQPTFMENNGGNPGIREDLDPRNSLSLPVSELLSKRVISLPMHPALTEEDQKTVVDALASAVLKSHSKS